jgi:hypothetical protein
MTVQGKSVIQQYHYHFKKLFCAAGKTKHLLYLHTMIKHFRVSPNMHFSAKIVGCAQLNVDDDASITLLLV